MRELRERSIQPGSAARRQSTFLRAASKVLVLASTFLACDAPVPGNPNQMNYARSAIEFPITEAAQTRQRPPAKRGTGVPGFFECTNRDLNWRTRRLRRLLRGFIPDERLPQSKQYCRADADRILRGSVRDIKTILSEKIHTTKENRGDVIALAIRLESDGRMSFLFGNYLERSHHGVRPDGSKNWHYEKRLDIIFPVDEINKVLGQELSRVRPPEPSMTSLRFKVGKSGNIFRCQNRR